MTTTPGTPPETESPRAWKTVLEHVERALLDGSLQPGDRLPGERQLSTDLGVGRSSVREAFRVLEVLGLIRTRSGSGPNAGAIIVATPRGGMSALMRLQVAAQGFPVDDVVRARLLLEASVAAELAAAVHDHDLADALQLLDAMEPPGLDPDEFLVLDAQFHVALAEASGNQVITAMMAGLRSAIEGYVLEGVPHIRDWGATADRLRHEHREILHAIERGDSADAEARIRDHITGYYAESLLPTPAQNSPAPTPDPDSGRESSRTVASPTR